MGYEANGLYPKKAQKSNNFNLSEVSKKRKLACHRYIIEELQESFDLYMFNERANSLKTAIIFQSMGGFTLSCVLVNTVTNKTQSSNRTNSS